MKRHCLKVAVDMAASAQATHNKTDWSEDYAYSLGVQAYIFSYPWVFLPQLQYLPSA
jgi:hypothetical protein